MKDLGKELYQHRRYDFTCVAARQILFKCTGDDVLMHCKVKFNGSVYEATLCLSFDQFNELLLAAGDSEMRTEVSALVGEALSMKDQNKLETTFQINLMKVFERSLRVQGCTYHTRLVKLPLEELVAEPDCAYVFLVRQMTFQTALR